MAGEGSDRRLAAPRSLSVFWALRDHDRPLWAKARSFLERRVARTGSMVAAGSRHRPGPCDRGHAAVRDRGGRCRREGDFRAATRGWGC
jgi:hypothetical protein